jgi:hypothetical protein
LLGGKVGRLDVWMWRRAGELEVVHEFFSCRLVCLQNPAGSVLIPGRYTLQIKE